MPKLIVQNELYIEPNSNCNLNCRMCYVEKKNQSIPEGELRFFIFRFAEYNYGNFSLYWCGGGEVFLYKPFVAIINEVDERYDCIHKIQTNGTVDLLDNFRTLKNKTFYVSMDLPKYQHDWFRGKGNFEKSIRFCRKVVEKGGALIIRVLVTKNNIASFNNVERHIRRMLGTRRFRLEPTFPYKNREIRRYSQSSSFFSKKDIDDELLLDDPADLFYDKNSNNYSEFSEDVLSLSLLSEGNVYPCCEGLMKIGDINTPLDQLYKKLYESKTICKPCPRFSDCFGNSPKTTA
jgi:MoaA/NifB/PqqE/SkfB family radical SAM enzyme